MFSQTFTSPHEISIRLQTLRYSGILRTNIVFIKTQRSALQIEHGSGDTCSLLMEARQHLYLLR